MKIQTEKTFKIATIAFLALSMGMILFPIQRAPTLNEVEFVWNMQQLQGVHGAASQRDYLFEDSANAPTYSGQLGTGTNTNKPINTTTGGAYQGSMGTATTVKTGTIGIQPQLSGKDYLAQDCRTPRGEMVKDKGFVLAYQQRTDAEVMCNIEKRVCINGILEGSYTQQSCKENVTYDYQRVKVISYNEKIVDPLIQPGTPSNAGADFSTEGKLGQTKTPTTSRGSTNDGQTVTTSQVPQTTSTKANCTTPRGTTINHGQFVKAYKVSVGLLDMPCETQLRLCVNGALGGKFLNKTCTVKNMTYNDFIAGNKDISKPTPQDIVDTLANDTTSGVNLFDRIRKLFE